MIQIAAPDAAHVVQQVVPEDLGSKPDRRKMLFTGTYLSLYSLLLWWSFHHSWSWKYWLLFSNNWNCHWAGLFASTLFLLLLYGYRICLLHRRHVTVMYLPRSLTLELLPGTRYERQCLHILRFRFVGNLILYRIPIRLARSTYLSLLFGFCPNSSCASSKSRSIRWAARSLIKDFCFFLWRAIVAYYISLRFSAIPSFHNSCFCKRL